MHGLDIFAKTNSVPTSGAHGFQFGNLWQYNSQSNRHSDTGVWAVFLDLLTTCELLRAHVVAGKVGIGVNYELVSPITGNNKNLDLVIARRQVDQFPTGGKPKTFKALGESYGMVLSDDQRNLLAALPDVSLLVATNLPVLLAIEAKACMTAHGKVHKSRLASELSDIHLTVHNSTQGAIAAGFIIVNAATRFVSPGLNKYPLPPLPGAQPIIWSLHRQPRDALKVVSSVQSLPRVTASTPVGFDAIGIGVISLENDGTTPITVVSKSPPAPARTDRGNYDAFIHELAQLYATRFSGL